jgi:acetyl-CoA/propionyl-CoA carboxylase biotin carboxyl carrier protein
VFETVLVANRGEIAVRIIRTLRRMGIRSVAVYSAADVGARHVREADEAVRLGGTSGREGTAGGYLDGAGIIRAARSTGAQAVHPGYGFLAENAGFAQAVTAAGLVFVGPPTAAVELMGDKIRAKRAAAAAGVPVVPGSHLGGVGPELGPESAPDAGTSGKPSESEGPSVAEAAARIGFPVLLKPSAGGGGKGMRLVRSAAELPEAVESAQREALASFGDGTLLVERWIDRPRHIEVQVLADAHGRVLHLGERECSLQRRHQKLIEEAPSPLLDAQTREAMGTDAVRVARACGYTGAGTVEFIVAGDRPDSYWFMEMNTRLQVEHPVTELTTGLDLVEWQLRVADGAALPWQQSELRSAGHAVEARICAETLSLVGGVPVFLPAGGRVLALAEPEGAGVRVDSGVVAGTVVGPEYDPMLAKVVALGADRPEALRRLRRALAGFAVLGTGTNTAFLRRLLEHPEVVAGRLDTGLVERDAAVLADPGPDEEVWIAAALARQLALRAEPDGAGWVDPFSVPSGWRPGEPAWTVHRLQLPGGEPVEVRVRGLGPEYRVRVRVAGSTEEEGPGDSGRAARAELLPRAQPGGADLLRVELGGVQREFLLAGDAGDDAVLWLGRDGAAYPVHVHDPVEAGGSRSGGSARGELTAPMPGTVSVVKASVGERVTAGQTVLVVEAMKMEHPLVAAFAGTVGEVRVRAGSGVAMDEVLAVIVPGGDGNRDGDGKGEPEGKGTAT